MRHTRPRYIEPWVQAWDVRVARELRPGIRILDVGSGRRPALPREHRPPDCTYVGLDMSLQELMAAPPGSYDQTVASDVLTFRPELAGRFDLVLSWQVLEHVKPLGQAFENIRLYLAPGGAFLAQLSGKFSVFALVNQLFPHRLSRWALKTFLGRDPATVFPAHYDQCWYGALIRMTSGWSDVEVLPRYRGSGYLRFLRVLELGYLRYEDWSIEHGNHNLATHYLISARR